MVNFIESLRMLALKMALQISSCCHGGKWVLRDFHFNFLWSDLTIFYISYFIILIHVHLFLRWINFDSGTSFVWDILRLKYWIIFNSVILFGNSCFPYVRLGIWANLPIFTNICKNGPYGPFLHGNRDVNPLIRLKHGKD